MSAVARLRAFGTNATIIGRLLVLATMIAVASGGIVLESTTDPGDGDPDHLTIHPEQLLTSTEVAAEQGLTGSVALPVHAGLSPLEPLIASDDAIRAGDEPVDDSAVAAATWDRLAHCESSGRWHLDAGNGYYGGLQFKLSSWRAVGGTGYPHEHPREVQIHKAERLLEKQGWRAWPSCSRQLGLR